MSSSTKTLVFLWLCLYQVSGFPAAKRPSAPGEDDDVISGSDFLTVFMSQRSDPSATARTAELTDRSSSTHAKSYYSRHEDNSVVLKFPILSQYSENYEKYNKPYDTDIDFREPNMSQDVSSEVNLPDVDGNSTKTSTTITEESPTTQEAEYFTAGHNVDKSQSDEPVKNDLQSTPTTESMKVISVRVSSSVARHSGKAIASQPESKQTESSNATSETDGENARIEEVITQTIEKQEGLQAEESQQSKASESNPFVLSDENLVSTLVTQDEPTITAARRDQFAVEEASAREEHAYLDVKPKELINVYEYAQQKSIPGVVREVKRIQTEESQNENQKQLLIGNYHNPPEALTSAQSQPAYSQLKLQENLSSENKESLGTPAGLYRQSDGHNMNNPASYRTSVATATSESRVQFYRDHPTYNGESVAETVQRSVVAKQEPVVPTQGNDSSNTAGGHRDARYQEKPHEEQTEKNYELPEQVYGRPEQNYEVDEGVSVVTNGRAHGLQIPTPQPDRKDQKDANHKFGYVVEGRNYRKYRVEERTPDGFIVGEYGVVSHDDGSLRGVRYTADSTINPRLIYDALVKFLSLK